MRAVAHLLFVIGLSCAVQACTPTQVQTAEATVPADAQLGLCIATVAEADAGKAISQVLLDELAQCTADIVPIVTILDGRVEGDLAKGTITLDAANSKLAEIHAAAKLPLPKLLVLPVKIGTHAINLPVLPPVWTFEPAGNVVNFIPPIANLTSGWNAP